jgi:hypothetical protein
MQMHLSKQPQALHLQNLSTLYTLYLPTFFYSLFIGIVGGGVRLGQLGTMTTSRPIVPAPGDYDDEETSGMMIGMGKQKYSEKTCPVPL